MPKKEANKPKTSSSTERLNSILVENFVNLQKAVTNLTVKFDNLADNLSKLLQLFEISARSFSEKLATTMPELEKDREFLDKLNKLLDQNKTIAKGLTLMEEKIRERVYGTHQPAQPQQQSMPAQFRTFQSQGYIPSQLEREKKATEEIQ